MPRAWFPVLPVAKGRPRAVRFGNRGRMITPPKTRRAEAVFAALAAHHPDAPVVPMGGPLRVSLEFLFPVPKSWPKWKRAAALAGEWRNQGKPDVDNLAKLCLDALQPGWFGDDRQVVDLRARKGYAEAPGVWLEWEELPQAERRKP